MTVESAQDGRLVELDGHVVRLTNLGRPLWPATGFTKAQMVDYYLRIARWMLPHLAGRPLMIGRWPEGVDAPGWGQFECRGRPDWMTVHPFRLRRGQQIELCGIDDAAALAWVANQGGLELHPYLGRAPTYDSPIGVVFDLDPGPPADIVTCAQVALLVRAHVASLGLESVVKTSGGSGLHVWVPLNTPTPWGGATAFARGIATQLSAAHPELVTATMTRAERSGRVFVDWAQNAARRQTVAAYSLRAGTRPLVSAPVLWSEVTEAAETGAGESLFFTPDDVLARVGEFGDPFAAAASLEQALPDASGE